MDSSSANDVAIGLPLAISLVTILGTIVIHAIALLGIFHFVRRPHLLRRTGVRFWRDVAIVSGATCWREWPTSWTYSSGQWCSLCAVSSADSLPPFTVPLPSTQPWATVTQSGRRHGKC